MIFRAKPRFELLDTYLAKRDYRSALAAIASEVKQRPESFNVLLRQAEILALAGDRSEAIAVYESLARHFIAKGFYARAIALTNKIQRIDPARADVTRQLAEEISRRQEAEEAARSRLSRASVSPRPAAMAAEPAAPAAAEVAGGDDTPPEQAAREQAASAFFHLFPRDALEELLSSTAVQVFQPDQELVREGDPGASLFLIAEGTVEVSTRDQGGTTLRLATLGPGEFFGEISTLTGLPRTATVTAGDAAVTVIEISRNDLERIFAAHPGVRETLRQFYEQRAHATVEAMVARVRGARD
jgi:cAMP-dependent protein kinase regulator